MLVFPLLLADIVDIIKVIFPLVLLVFWILSQVFGQKGPKVDAPPAGNPRPQQPGQGGLRDEVDRFLREAKQQQNRQEDSPRDRELGQQGASNPDAEKKKRAERQRRKEEKQREAARQRAKELASASRRTQAEPEIVEDVMVVGPASTLSQHVSSYMDSSKFRESASHLGEQVGLADERLALHLNQAFGHQANQLAGQPNEVARGGAAVIHNVVSGAQLSVMLRDPMMFRHAVVLNEILTRPEHRW